MSTPPTLLMAYGTPLLSELLNAVLCVIVVTGLVCVLCVSSDDFGFVLSKLVLLGLAFFCIEPRDCLGRTSPKWPTVHLGRSRTQNLNQSINLVLSVVTMYNLPSVLWRCWLDSRKGIRPVKNRVVGCWLGYLSGVRCRLAYGSADATATHCLLLQ